MTTKPLPEVLRRAFQSEDDTAFVFEVEDKLRDLIDRWYGGRGGRT